MVIRKKREKGDDVDGGGDGVLKTRKKKLEHKLQGRKKRNNRAKGRKRNVALIFHMQKY